MIHNPLPHDHGNHFERLPLPEHETFGVVSDLMKLMGDSTRLEIFWLLCHCEECVINISAFLKLSSPTVCHHLKLLKTAGLIISRREGKEVYYTAVKTERTVLLHDAIEALLEMSCPFTESFEDGKTYDSQIQTVHEIHGFLTGDLKTRHTIEELSQKFHINQTTLKTLFKTVYGQPIAAYMKDYRMKKAMELLKDPGKSISEIGCEVGYENQSKFTQAFKDVTGMLPRDYRKSTI